MRGRKAQHQRAGHPQYEVAGSEFDEAAAPIEAPQSNDPLQRHRNMASMSEGELRAYALQVGVSRRDAESLSPDRLRQNCALTLYQLIEDL